MKDIVLLGGGGHCKSVIDAIRGLNEYNIVGILDVKQNIGKKVCGIEIIDIDSNASKYIKAGVQYAFISVGSVGNVSLRKKLNQIIIENNFILPTIIDSSAVVSDEAIISKGVFVGKNAVINAGVSIGENCICNTGSIIEHDCDIQNYVHISPGATICGGVKVGANSHIGANSTIIQYKTIGRNVIIGAGSVVVKNVPDNIVGYGNPFKEVKKNE